MVVPCLGTVRTDLRWPLHAMPTPGAHPIRLALAQGEC